MAHSEGLEFIEEIRVAQFWRSQLGDFEYTKRDADDLYRWYNAMELRGPQEIRALLIERASRFPEWPVTGIVAKAPHPPREIIDIWLSTHERVRTGSYWAALGCLMVASVGVLSQFSGCQSVHSWNPQVNWLPQAAVLAAGTNKGVPAALATMPSQGPPAPISVASPSAASIAQQNANSVPQSTPLGAYTGIMTKVTSAASNSVSSASLTPATPSAAPVPAAAATQSNSSSSKH